MQTGQVLGPIRVEYEDKYTAVCLIVKFPIEMELCVVLDVVEDYF